MLQQRLIQHIETFGPLTVRAFQDIVLFDAKDGYYAHAKVVGRTGDFITSPEISQVFGEIIALSIVNHWQDMGRPNNVLLAELGPGLGTLMADMIRIFKQFPDFYNATRIYLVDVCLSLLQQQKVLLGNTITQIPSLSVAPESAVTFVVANEFFDALPVDQFIYDPITYTSKPRLINYNNTDGWHFVAHENHEKIIETSELSLIHAAEIRRRLTLGQGMAIIIDYGDDCKIERFGDTLQAVHQHRHVSVFEHIGQADLSHHVDFASLKDAMAPLSTDFATQGEFLIQNGIYERTEQLAQKHPKLAADLRIGTSRLTAPSAMGSLFKILVATS